MNISSMHSLFRVVFDKFDSLNSPEFTPEAVDVLFRDKERELIEDIASRYGVESTQTLTDYLGGLYKRAVIAAFTTDSLNEPNGKYVELPSDYKKTLMEQATVIYADCHPVRTINPAVIYVVSEGSILYNSVTYTQNQFFTGVLGKTSFTGRGKVFATVSSKSRVIPVTRDEYLEILRNPFKAPDEDTVLRLASVRASSTVPLKYELITSPKVSLTNYQIDYIKVPQVLQYGSQYAVAAADVDSELSDEGTREIVMRAVKEATKIVMDPRFEAFKIEERNLKPVE